MNHLLKMVVTIILGVIFPLYNIAQTYTPSNIGICAPTDESWQTVSFSLTSSVSITGTLPCTTSSNNIRNLSATQTGTTVTVTGDFKIFLNSKDVYKTTISLNAQTINITIYPRPEMPIYSSSINVCSGKLFGLPLSTKNAINTNIVGYMWTTTATAYGGVAQTKAPVLANSPLAYQTLTHGQGQTLSTSYAITAIIDTQLAKQYDGVSYFANASGCTSNTTDVQYKITSGNIKPNAGTDQTVCIRDTTEEVSLSGQKTVSNTEFSFVWYQISGPTKLTFDNLTTPTAKVTGFKGTGLNNPTASNKYLIGCYQTNSVCDTLRDTVEISVWDKPLAKINTPDSQYFCNAEKSTSTIKIEAQSPYYGRGVWTVVSTGSPAPAIPNPSNTSFSITNKLTNNDETYTYTWTVTGGNTACGTASQSIKVFAVHSPSAAQITSNTLIRTCDPLITLTAANPTYGIGSWSLYKIVSGGVPTIAQKGTSLDVTRPAITSNSGILNYIFQWKVKSGTCDSTIAYDTVYMYTPDTAKITVDTAWVCAATSATLTAKPLISATGSWTFLPALSNASTPTIGSPTSTTTNITGLAIPNGKDTSLYAFAWTASGGGVGITGCTSIIADTVWVAVVNQPSNAGNDATMYFCTAKQDTLTLTTPPPAVGRGVWTGTIVSGNGSITILNPYSPTVKLLISPPSSDTMRYKLQWTISNGSACTPSIKTVNLNIVNYNLAPTKGARDTLWQCATVTPQPVFLTPKQNYTGGNIVWDQIKTLSDAVIANGFPNSNYAFTIYVNPPQGAAMNKYYFSINYSYDKCVSLNQDTIVLLVTNPPTSPTFPANTSYTDTNYVCYTTGNIDTLFNLSIRYASGSIIGTGKWSQTFSKPSNSQLEFYNILTRQPDTMPTINLIIKPSNVITTSGDTAQYQFTWKVTSGQCTPALKNVYFYIIPNVILGVANIKNKGKNSIHWLCSSGTSLSDTLRTAGIKSNALGRWTQIVGTKYYSSTINPSKINDTTFNVDVSNILSTVKDTKDTIKLAYVWNVLLSNGGKCSQTSSDTVYLYVVSPPPNIRLIKNGDTVCGNVGSSNSIVVTAQLASPLPFGTLFWGVTQPSPLTVTNTANNKAVIGGLQVPSVNTVYVAVKNAGCGITTPVSYSIKMNAGAKAQVIDNELFVGNGCNTPYTTINNKGNEIISAAITLPIRAQTPGTGTTSSSWTLGSGDNTVVSLPSPATSATINPTFTISSANGNISKDSSKYVLLWTVNSTTCGTTVDSSIVTLYPPVTATIVNKDTCLTGNAGDRLTLEMQGSYVSQRQSTWSQNTQTTGIVSGLNWVTSPLLMLSPITADGLKIQNIQVPKTSTGNAYKIIRSIQSNIQCDTLTDTAIIKVYQVVSTAKVKSPDTTYKCGVVSTDIVTLQALNPIVGIGEWTIVSAQNKLGQPIATPNITKINDTTINVSQLINPSTSSDYSIYRFRWTTYINECNTNKSNKDVYIMITNGNGTSSIDKTKNPIWLCQQDTITLYNQPYTGGTGTWSSSYPGSSVYNYQGIQFTNVTPTSVKVKNMPFPRNNDTAKYLIKFDIKNGGCASSTDSISIFIVNKPSLASLRKVPYDACGGTKLPDNSIVNTPTIGKGTWKLDTVKQKDASLTITAIWTVTNTNICPSSSDTVVYNIAGGIQTTSQIYTVGGLNIDHTTTPRQDTLTFCLKYGRDTSILATANSYNTAIGGTGEWGQSSLAPTLLNFKSASRTTITPAVADSNVNISGFTSNDSISLYGIVWTLYKKASCSPNYDTAYIKVFRAMPKPIFSNDTITCVPTDTATIGDSLVFPITPLNGYTYGNFSWSIVSNDNANRLSILPPTESKQTGIFVLKPASALPDAFTYVVRLKVWNGICGADSTDYRIVVYPMINNKNAFAFDDNGDSSKLVKLCVPNAPPVSDTMHSMRLANNTLQPYQKGVWSITYNPNKAYLKNPNNQNDTNSSTRIKRMRLLTSGITFYTLNFTITNTALPNNTVCQARDTVQIFLLSQTATINPGHLKSDTVCYGALGKTLTLENVSGAIRFNWERSPVGKNIFVDVPNASNYIYRYTYTMPEITEEYDYRVMVRYQFTNQRDYLNIGCPVTSKNTDYSDTATVFLRNKSNFRNGHISPDTLTLCGKDPNGINMTITPTGTGMAVAKWQQLSILNGSGKSNTHSKLGPSSAWKDISNTKFTYDIATPDTSRTVFYRAWLYTDPTIAVCPFVTDTTVVYIHTKPKITSRPMTKCDNGDTTVSYYFYNASEYYLGLDSGQWAIANTPINGNIISRTGNPNITGRLANTLGVIQYVAHNNDTLPTIDTIKAVAMLSSKSNVLTCTSDTVTGYITVNPSPKADFINTRPLAFCSGTNIKNILKIRHYPTTNTTLYTWSVTSIKGVPLTGASTGIYPNITAPNYTIKDNDTVLLHLTADNKYTGCQASTSSDTLFSYGTVLLSIKLDTDVICYGTPISIKNLSRINTRLKDTISYKWVVDGDTISRSPTPPVIAPSKLDPHIDNSINLQAILTSKCGSKIFDTNIIVQNIPKGNLVVNRKILCSGDTVVIRSQTVLGSRLNSFIWQFGDGSTRKLIGNLPHNPLKPSIDTLQHIYDTNMLAVDTLRQIISNNCASDTQTELIAIFHKPIASIGNLGGAVCGGYNVIPILNKTDFQSVFKVKYNWYINDLLVKTVYTNDPSKDTLFYSFSPDKNTKYNAVNKISLEAVPDLGCGSRVDSFIMVYPTAQPVLSYQTIQPCPPAEFLITVNSPAANTFAWYVNDVLLPVNSSSLNMSFPNTIKYNIKVVVNSSLQVCPIDSAFDTITIYPYPQAAFALLTPAPYCYSPFPARYQSNAIDADPVFMPITEWDWKFDTTFREGKELTYIYPVGNIYTTKHWVKDDRGQNTVCVSDTITRQYTINGRSISRFAIPDIYCAQDTFTTTNSSTWGFNSSSIDSSYWEMGDGSPLIKMGGSISLNGFNYTYQKGGMYNVTLYTKGNASCIFDTLTKTIKVRGAPQVDVAIDAPCSGNHSTFMPQVIPGYLDEGISNYIWKFDDGFTTTVTSPVRLYENVGTYSLSLTAYGLLCRSLSTTLEKQFTIKQAPAPTFYTLMNVVKDVPFTLTAPSDDKYVWLNSLKEIADTNNPTAQSITKVLRYSGTDTFYARTTRDKCYVDNVQVVQAYPSIKITAPTAFTPNNDGVNDYFIPRYIGIKKLKIFEIYNRWGQVIFSTTDITKAWDGRFNGKELPTDTYIWIATGIDDNGEPISGSGGVTLIRGHGF